MVLCDEVHRDPTTNKSYVLGTLSVIWAHSFPAVHPKLAVFLQLTDAMGPCDLTLKLARVTADDPEGQTLWDGELPVIFPDKRSVVELRVVLGNVVLQQPGEYRVILECRGTLIMERRLLAVAEEGAKEGEDHG